MTKETKTSRSASSKRASAAPGVEKLNMRQQQSAARRDAILSAALDEFSARGFAATRIEDIAERAGVAKGTIYLYFADKEALFQDIVRTMVVPFIATLEAMPPVDVPIRMLLEGLIDRFIREVYSTRRREVVKLVIGEVPRFPKLAEFYYHAVVERAIAAVRVPIAHAVKRGELPSDTLLRFPQLIIAPALLAVVWSGLFERLAPLDVKELMRAHLDLILGKDAGK